MLARRSINKKNNDSSSSTFYSFTVLYQKKNSTFFYTEKSKLKIWRLNFVNLAQKNKNINMSNMRKGNVSNLKILV